MIPIEVKDGEGGLTERLVQDVHDDGKVALEGAGLWDCLDYFEIADRVASLGGHRGCVGYRVKGLALEHGLS